MFLFFLIFFRAFYKFYLVLSIFYTIKLKNSVIFLYADICYLYDPNLTFDSYKADKFPTDLKPFTLDTSVTHNLGRNKLRKVVWVQSCKKVFLKYLKNNFKRFLIKDFRILQINLFLRNNLKNTILITSDDSEFHKYWIMLLLETLIQVLFPSQNSKTIVTKVNILPVTVFIN